jgi:hypothetical protein
MPSQSLGRPSQTCSSLNFSSQETIKATRGADEWAARGQAEKRGTKMSQRHRDLAKHKTNTNVGGTAGTDKFLGDLQVKAHRRSARLAEDDAQLAFINDEMNRINDKKDALKAKFAKDTMYRDEMRATIKIVKDTLQKVRLSRPHPLRRTRSAGSAQHSLPRRLTCIKTPLLAATTTTTTTTWMICVAGSE